MSLTQLPYELEENILEYLPYDDVSNYCLTNRRAGDVCDTFFKRRAQLENIPLYLLPENNVADKYMQLLKDKSCLQENKLRMSDCFKNAIDNNNFGEIKWLTSLMKNNKYPGFQSSPVAFCLIKTSYYAFRKNNDTIGLWLLSNLPDFYEDNKLRTLDVTRYQNLIKIIQYLIINNKIDVIHHILDEISDSIFELGKVIFFMFARYNDPENLIYMIDNYDMTINDYNVAIANSNSPDIVQLLLRHYPGNKDDLNRIFSYKSLYLTREILEILLNYGVDDYSGIFTTIINSISRGNENTYNDVRWFLSHYSFNIPRQYISYRYNITNDNEIKKILSLYF